MLRREQGQVFFQIINGLMPHSLSPMILSAWEKSDSTRGAHYGRNMER